MSSTIHYLEMRSPGELQPPSRGAINLEFRPVCDPAKSERLYREVGGSWQWTDRLVWSSRQWKERVELSEVWIWVASLGREEVGFVEFERQPGGNVEIVYFGLHPGMIGRGLGGAMLTQTVHMIWEKEGTKRVWLHTCSEDHPHALKNYEKRGFRLFKTEQENPSD